SSVAVSTGSRVSTGQSIGSVGASPDGSSGRLLHFQLWHERTKLNPLAWIKR
ncbi:MAG: M23 family metallopeptidase, partial [Porphyromonadaceae bacterium]|nr:M23 family metallopeptidase [Porphyromonadaceae bacterium]